PVVVDDHVHVSGRDSRRVVLAHIDANVISRKVTLQVQSTCIFGRSAQHGDVSIDDSQLSRQHCALSLDQDSVLVQDLQSTNGTYLNGVLVQGKRPLQPNDTIRIGGSTLQIISIGGGSNG
ncbi:MAG: FHA domain-containing protein, partial [Clostridiaceae bacterium]|nr:FHA domain-containing protein [Clostridiaceae bacterium]